IKASRDLNPESCRSAARDHYSSRRMIERYLNVYNRIVSAAEGGAQAELAGGYASSSSVTSLKSTAI
ncbi:MAG: hypothetical protein JWO48_3020, partial [Bryobacterales bacterium]|nr:hypothetical protein [Bryobacterales bacterium]